MHLLDEEELAHVGKILRRGYVRVHKPKKKEKVKYILFCVLYSALAILFLGLGAYCIYLVVNGLYLFFALSGVILSAVLIGISLREIHLSLDHYPPPFGNRRSVRSEPNFLPEPPDPADILSYQSSATSSRHQSLHNFIHEETASISKSTSDNEVVTYSTSEESVKFVKAAKIIRSVSQYKVDNAPNEDVVKTVAESSLSSSRKRFSHNFEIEEGLVEMETSPVVKPSVPVGTKEANKVSERGSSQSLPAIKFMSNSDT